MIKLFSLKHSFIIIGLIIFTIIMLMYKKQYNQILLVIPSLLLWLTYILGPVSNFRYVWPLFMLYPMYIYLILSNNIKEDEKSK